MAGSYLKTTLTALSMALLLAACNENEHDTQVNTLKTLRSSNPDESNFILLSPAAGILALQAQYPDGIFRFLSVIKYLNRASNPAAGISVIT